MSNCKYFLAYGTTIALILAVFLVALLLEEPSRESFLREGGPVEMASALIYFFCFGLVAAWGRLFFFEAYPYFALVPLLFGLRELDIDKAFTTTGIFKIRFFTSAEVPFYEKIFGFLLITALLYMIYALIRHQTKNYLGELRKRTPLAIGASLVAGLTIVSKTLDGLGRKLESVGINVSESVNNHSSELEEILELGIPIAMIITFVYYFRERATERQLKGEASAETL